MSHVTVLLNIGAGQNAALVEELSEENCVTSKDCTLLLLLLLLLLLFPCNKSVTFDDPAAGQSTVWPL